MTEFLVERVDAVVTLAPSWGLPLIFVLMMVESSFIPFPSEVVMIPAGFLAARGEISLPGAVIAGILGSLGGAWLNYLLARHLGQPALLRLGRYVFLPPERLLRAEEIFRRHGAAATFFCRLLPAIRQLISIPAGLSGMAALPFTLWTGLGAGIWVAFLTGVGFVIGQQTRELSYAEVIHTGKDIVSANLLWIVPLCLAGLVGYVLLERRIMGPMKP
jgi:membrane protein DedA with SNARE-associated domain